MEYLEFFVRTTCVFRPDIRFFGIFNHKTSFFVAKPTQSTFKSFYERIEPKWAIVVYKIPGSCRVTNVPRSLRAQCCKQLDFLTISTIKASLSNETPIKGYQTPYGVSASISGTLSVQTLFSLRRNRVFWHHRAIFSIFCRRTCTLWRLAYTQFHYIHKTLI